MLNDKQLVEAVQSEIKWEPSLDGAAVTVAAKNGIVTLGGHVPTYVGKLAAEKAANRVRGVKAVAEEIEVRLPFSVKRDDAEIAAAVVNRYKWDLQVPDQVKIMVEQGRVTLTGEVEWQYQKQAAADHARFLTGVTGVSNQITLKTRVDVGDIADDIDAALGRSWFSGPETIKVTANGGKVKLTGTARSYADRMLATDAAWAAPGATSVENDIVVV